LELDAIPQNAAEAEALIGALGEADVPAEAAPAAAPVDEFVINYKGKEERYPREKIISFAQQGRDYAEKMAAFNQEKTRWSQLEQEYNGAKSQWQQVEQRLKNYSDIEAYQKQDPQWWAHVNEMYQQKLTERGGQPAMAQLPPEIAKEFEELRQFKTELAQEREQAQRVKEDQVLDLQVSSYRDKYPQFDWAEVDGNGQNLEQRILKFAMENGLSKPEHFQIAANNFLFDEHVKRASHAAKEGVGKHLEKVTKLGLGPVTNQPTSRLKQVSNVASKDWNEIAEEAKSALGL
jgi:vacuolar-type H+-ATPase subunit I/STV1